MKKMIIMLLMLASMLSFAKKEKIKNKLGLAVKPGVNTAADIRRDVTPVTTEIFQVAGKSIFQLLIFLAGNGILFLWKL